MKLSNRVDDAVDWGQSTRPRARIGERATREMRRDTRVDYRTPALLSLARREELLGSFSINEGKDLR